MSNVQPSFECALVQSIASGNLAALSALYDLTRAQLFAVARHLLHTDTEAYQAVFGVFEHIWNFADEYQEGDALMPWLVAITEQEARRVELFRDQNGSYQDSFAIWFMLERSAADIRH